MSSSLISSIQESFRYDVFLSFRGKDTRKNFVDHLYYALMQKGIRTYKDDESIIKGKKISDELIRSIEDSKFYIIVFSKNYASSSWCLEELVKIMECQRMDHHTAYPVFFDVEPTEIRKQSGCVEMASARHRNEKCVGKWRDALNEAADLAGWELKNTANGHEAKFIQQIVENISLDLRFNHSSIDRKLVGMEARAKDVVLSLKIGCDDFRMIGIKGMRGAGKTTLARVVYDRISTEFQGSSFLENVREVSNGSLNSLMSLQEQMLSDVLNDKSISISSVSDGKRQMKKLLCTRKVLVVLDDVDSIEQLKALTGEPYWYKAGSIIIITTRDEQVLVAHGVHSISDVNLLSPEEAICLFNMHAFGTEVPTQRYKELSEMVVLYAAGLPLMVSVLGFFLFGESVDLWINVVQRLKTISLEKTLEKWETGLEDGFDEIYQDIKRLKTPLKESLHELETNLEDGFEEMYQDIKRLKTPLKESLHKLETNLEDEFDEMSEDITITLDENLEKLETRLEVEFKDIYDDVDKAIGKLKNLWSSF